MKIDVSTGHTKAPAGTLLVPLVLGGEKGDKVFFLLHSEGKSSKTGDARNMQDECVSVLTHSILDGEGDAYTRLESALKELNGLLKGFQLSDVVEEVHALVGLLEPDGNFHLSHVGRAEAYLIRDGAATQITEYSRGKQPVAFLHIVSGPLEPGDHVMLSSQRLLRTITPAQLAQIAMRGEDAVADIVKDLESEKEVACISHIIVEPSAKTSTAPTRPSARLAGHTRGTRKQGTAAGISGMFSRFVEPAMGGLNAAGGHLLKRMTSAKGKGGNWLSRFLADLSDPARKRRAHLLLLAGLAGLFLIVWMIVQLSLSTQKSQTRGELEALIAQINTDISTADNRKLAGDTDSANAILQRAEDRARQVMANESGLFRSDALNLLDRIRSKKEEMNNIVRVPPRVMATLTAKKADVSAIGMIGLSDGEFLVYDHQNYYRVLLNSVEGPTGLNTEELIVDGVSFPRFQSQVFLTTGNSIIELQNGQTSVMKTEDPNGWVTGADVKTYLRYMYVLSPEKRQIYKYEHLAGRYGPASEYNVSGDLKGAIDMTITGPVYVLKETTAAKPDTPGQHDVIKLLRGEKQNFTIRNLPPGALNGVTKIYKSSPNGNFYFLDPSSKRIVVTTNDGDLGESLYLRQYILDSDQVGKLQDIYADPDDSRLYVLDEKRLYVVDVQGH